MNVKEMIEALQELPEDLVVYTAIDEEGNGYNETYFAPTIMWKLKDKDKGFFSDVINADQEDLDDLELTRDDVVEIVVI